MLSEFFCLPPPPLVLRLMKRDCQDNLEPLQPYAKGFCDIRFLKEEQTFDRER